MEMKDLAQLVEYENMELPAQQIIINGQTQAIKQQIAVVKCPNCKEIITDLGQAIPEAYIRRVLTDNKDALYAKFQYCPHCGQKLQWESEVIDTEVEVINIEDVVEPQDSEE